MIRYTIVRHGEPNKHDTCKRGTVCKSCTATECSVYVQMSHDEENPRWELVGTYASTVSNDYIDAEIEEILKLKL